MSVVQGDCGVVSMVQGVVQSGTVRGCRNVRCGECRVVSVMQPARNRSCTHGSTCLNLHMHDSDTMPCTMHPFETPTDTPSKCLNCTESLMAPLNALS